MRILLTCLFASLLLITGCDTFMDMVEGKTAGKDYARKIEGVWSISTTIERIARDGTVTQTWEEGPYEITISADSVPCGPAHRPSMTLRNEGDLARVTSLDNGSGMLHCGILKIDKEGNRIIEVVSALVDHAGMIRDYSRNHHVWEFYHYVDGYDIDRHRWVLTR